MLCSEQGVIFQGKPALQGKSFTAFILTWCAEVRSNVVEYAPHLNLYECSTVSTAGEISS
jgi:hypothetical protein